MRATGRIICCAILMVFFIPLSGNSFDRDGGKEAAFRAGFNNGYRDGLRHGEYDSRAHLRYNYHSREYDRADIYYHGYIGHKGQYKKGYRDGYRQGYREGYRRVGFPRFPRERYW